MGCDLMCLMAINDWFVCNPPPVCLLTMTEWLVPLFSVVCSSASLALLIWVHGYVVSLVTRTFPSEWSRKPSSGCLAASARKKKGAADKLQAQHWSHHFQLNSPHYSSSQHLSTSLHPYLTAKTSCLTEGIHNSSYRLLIYTTTNSPIPTCKYGESIQSLWCQNSTVM